MEIAARQQKKPIPAPLKLVSPFALRALFFVAPRVIPLDLETYLKVHFTKVNDQTRFFVERFVTLAREQQQGSATLEKLLAQTAPAPTK